MEQTVSTLLQNGALGAICVGLGFTVVHLYRENNKLWQKLLDIQETRRLETLETSKELTSTLSTFSQNTELLIGKIVTVQRGKR